MTGNLNIDDLIHAEIAKIGDLAAPKRAEVPGCFLACDFAAWNGHLACMKYGSETGCPQDEAKCIVAVTFGHAECLRIAREHGCPGTRKGV